MLPNRRDEGYSLIEVLVAMAILAMALTVLMRVFAGGLRNIDVSADYSRAMLIAESQLHIGAVAAGSGPALDTGIVDGRYHWTREVQRYRLRDARSVESQPVAAYSVSVAVEWPHRDRMRSVSLNSVELVNEKGTVR